MFAFNFVFTCEEKFFFLNINFHEIVQEFPFYDQEKHEVISIGRLSNHKI